MFKSWFPESRDYLPLTWWNRHPVYLAAVLAIAGVATMVVYALLGGAIMSQLVFQIGSGFTLRHLWTPFTYVLVNPPSLWTLFGCYLLWRFGEAVERHFGRRLFVNLLALLLVAPPVAVTVLHVAGWKGLGCAGMGALDFGVFVAFATLYPRAKINLILFSIDAWLLAVIFVGMDALQIISVRNWGSLILLASNVGTAWFFVRVQKGEIKLPKISIRPSSPTKKPASKSPGKAAPSVDQILDKISQKGIKSLTAEERRILEDHSRKNQ